jgi:hypothetical protein
MLKALPIMVRGGGYALKQAKIRPGEKNLL